jgi:hypothetical protein
MTQEQIEQQIRDLLGQYIIPPGYIDEYISCILAYSSFEDYIGITDEAILADFEDWMDPDVSWKAK